MDKAAAAKSLVVYADDDQDDLALVQDALSKYKGSIELVQFSNGAQALEFLSSIGPSDETPCLIILDINMPLFSGRELLPIIRNMEKFEQLPIVLFTTSNAPSDRQFAMKYNAGFVTKPLNHRQMDEICDQLLEHCAEEVKSKFSKSV